MHAVIALAAWIALTGLLLASLAVFAGLPVPTPSTRTGGYMAKHDALINKLWPGDAHKESRAIARQWVEHFENQAMMAVRIEPLLREAARGDAMIRSGSKSVDEAQTYLRSFASEALGTPSHLVDAMAAWAPNLDAASGETPEQPPAQPAQPQPSPAPAAAPARPATAAPAPDRAALQAEITKWESAMRSPEGSMEWKNYWRGPGQQAYLAALQGLETAPETAAPRRCTRARGAVVRARLRGRA